MLSPREKKKIEKVCEDNRRKYGEDAAFNNAHLNLQRGSSTLAEYEYAMAYMRKWGK